MISTSVLNFLLEIAVLSFIFPVVFVLVWKMRHHKSFQPTFLGMAIYFVFSELFVSIPYMLLIGLNHPLGIAIRSQAVVLAICTGFITSVLEELGRFLAFRYFIKPDAAKERETSISYGLGHGGLACMLTLGWGNLQYYVTATVLNQENGAAKDLPAAIVNALKDMSSFDCIMDACMGILCFMLQIALSVLIFQAYRNKKLRTRLMSFAIGLHTLSYIPGGLYDAHAMPKIAEFILILLVVLVTIALAAHIYHEMGVKEEEEKQKTQRKGTSAPDEKNWSIANKKLSEIGKQDGGK